MIKKIKICTQFCYEKPFLDWMQNYGSPEIVYFDHDTFEIVKFEDFHKNDKNYIVLHCLPWETLDFFKRKSQDFYDSCIKNNISFVFSHEGWNLFMIDENIFNGYYDINNLLYWQIVNYLKEKKILEENLYFIHGAQGYPAEVEKIRNTIVRWTGSPIDIKSKHLELPLYLPWAQKRKTKMLDHNFKYHYSCLFAGRPAQHRHDLIKSLWQKNLLGKGKNSLTKVPDNSAFGKLPDLIYEKISVQYHSVIASNYNEDHVFEDIFLWVAGETAVPNPHPNFSEKTVRALFFKRPFILLGNAGSLKYLKSFGFQTFDSFWDESYDNDINFQDKIEKISKIIETICSKNLNELNKMYFEMKTILEHNNKILFETNWLDRVVKFLS
jgi:hypothetical protein